MVKLSARAAENIYFRPHDPTFSCVRITPPLISPTRATSCRTTTAVSIRFALVVRCHRRAVSASMAMQAASINVKHAPMALMTLQKEVENGGEDGASDWPL